jgi:hypothetical protein
MDPRFEFKAQRLANDLEYGNVGDAISVIRDELYSRPCSTRDLIYRAESMTSRRPALDVYETSWGDINIRDLRRGPNRNYHAGTIPQFCDRGPGPGPFPIPIPIPIPIPFPRRGHDHDGRQDRHDRHDRHDKHDRNDRHDRHRH